MSSRRCPPDGARRSRPPGRPRSCRLASSPPGRPGRRRTSGSSSRPRRWRSRTPGSASLLDVRVRRDALAREDVRQLLHVGTADHGLALLMLLAEPVHELRTQDVDLAVEDPALVGDLLLLLRELLDELLQLVVRERAEIRERVQCGPFQKRGWATIALPQPEVEASRIARTPSCRYRSVAASVIAIPAYSTTSSTQ